ncbi:hypothetical protein CHS0354_023254 [Potamilus streckersoni]|uniref:UBZ1-type domain-containing protein n=1 Tax=Potamilus streckersoni TaxID=2493646 RepID=A0AAE0S357_9BIVA|nr:hypothetical protein CHS0354_023254 [Potamilus streckersoni]
MDRNSDDDIELLENGKDGEEQNMYGSPESIYQNFPGFSVSAKAQVNPASLHALQTAFQGLHKQFIEQSKKLEEYQRKSAIMQRAIAEHGTNSISELEQILCADIPNEAHASGAMTETSIAAESRARQGYQTYLERENLRKDTAMQKLQIENVALRKRLEQLEIELRDSLRERDSIHHDLECITHSFEEKTAECNILRRKLEELEKRLRTLDSDMAVYLKRDKEQEEIIFRLQQQLEVYQKSSMGASEFQRKEEEYLNQIHAKDMQIGQLGLQCTRLEEDVQRLRMAGNESIPSGSDELDSDTRQLKEALDSVNWHKDMVRSLQDEVKQQQMYIKELMALVKGQRLKASESNTENAQNSFQPVIEDLTKFPSSPHQSTILFPPSIKDQLYVGNKSQYNVRYAPDGKEPSPNEFKEPNVEVPDFIMNSASSLIRRTATGINKTDCRNISYQDAGSREQTFSRSGAVGASNEQIKSSTIFQQVDMNRAINPTFPLKSDVKKTHSEGVLRMQEQPRSAVGNRTTVGETQKFPNYENPWRTPTTSPIHNTAGVPYNNLNHNSPTGLTNPLNNSRYSPSPGYPQLPSPGSTSPRPQTSPVGTSQNIYMPLNISQQAHTKDSRPVTNASSSDSEKICPLCKTNFSYLNMDDFQAHVFECFDGDENHHQTSVKLEPRVQTKGPSPSDDRTCPMCNAVFPQAIPQEEYERHVLEHFGEEPIIDRFEVLH